MYICIVADDTDVYILLLFVAVSCESHVYFRQGTKTSQEGIKYHNVKAVAYHLGNDACRSLHAFHVALEVITPSPSTDVLSSRS